MFLCPLYFLEIGSLIQMLHQAQVLSIYVFLRKSGFHSFKKILAAIDTQYLDSLIHCRLQKDDILFLPFCFHVLL